ncbi:polymorphic toxin type 15 domain-containing protein [Streptococcus suis]|uniref:polymorphic toxin type 15 domain-containing protein n=1 Tax=Streptococcus suis TaxID=1307 RepID=UPI003703D6B9
MQNNPANYTDPSGNIRSPHAMFDDRFGGKVYNRPRPLINPDDGTLYAPSTPQHKAHQIRQQQTGNYSYVYTPKVYSNTPIIKPTSYEQAQAQRDRAREQALAEQRRQQNIRNEYSRATGSKGKAKTREAQNLFKNWGAALSSMYTHVCKTAKRWVDSGVKFLKNVDWKKVGVTVGAIGVGIALTVATGGLGAPAAMALGGAATGAIISGYDGYTSGKRGWELVGAIGQGAGVGALTGFVGGHLMGAGAGIATSATQNIRNQAVRHVVKAGIEAGVETAVDTGISVATGSPVTLKNVVTDYGLNLVTNGSGSISTKKVSEASLPKIKPKAGDVKRTPEVEIQFSRNSKHDADEFSRQLKNQQDGMNKLTVKDYIDNRGDYLANGRSSNGNAAQKAAREAAQADKYNELRNSGLSHSEAKTQSEIWMKTQHALHDPDQIAGGFANKVTGIGDAGVNSSIGSQWKSRIGAVDNIVDELVRTTPYEDLDKIYLNVKLRN